MNVSSQPKTLYEGTVIAKISPVSEIASPVSGKIHSKTELPPYLKDLLRTTPDAHGLVEGSMTFLFSISCMAYHIHPVGGREPVLEVPLPALHFGLRFHV
jgi:hypothetical protein